MIDVFTPKRSSPKFPFQSKQRQVKTSRAQVPGPNPASSTMILMRCRIILIKYKISGQRGKPFPEAKNIYTKRFRFWLRNVQFVSAVCIFQNLGPLTPRYIAHRGDDLRGEAKSKPNSKILQPVCQGPRWVRIIKNLGQQSCDTPPLSPIVNFNFTFNFQALVFFQTVCISYPI